MTQNTERVLLKGNEALAYGAVAASCQCYFGYPITPQNEVPELLSRILPEAGGAFVQAESEVASINMLLGAGAVGKRAMTSSSGPGISLMQEGISYMAGSELPGVIVNMSRGGPGLGDIGPSQGDYFQATRGGGHGDYRTLVLAPSSAQECYDMMFDAFHLAFKYRNPVLVLGDAIVGQMKEPVLRHAAPALPADDTAGWRLEGCKGRSPRLLKSVWLNDGELALLNEKLLAKYESMQQDVRVEALELEDAELVLVAFGSMGRMAGSVARTLRAQGHKVGVLRPLTLFPFPSALLAQLAAQGKRFLVIEQNCGQMVDDVRLAVRAHADAAWHGIMPGLMPCAEDLVQPVLNALGDA